MLQRSLAASEVERRRIATDLHDGVVQDLAGVALTLAGAARDRGMPEAPAAVFEHAATSIRSSITALRTTLVDIYPPELVRDGLRSVLMDLAADSAVIVHCDLADLPDQLPDPLAQALYRVAREALRNVNLHAGARTATLRAGSTGPTTWIEIRDDGAGFDPDTLALRVAEGHLGLMGLDGLARDAGGRFSVVSAPGDGTTVRAEFPLR